MRCYRSSDKRKRDSLFLKAIDFAKKDDSLRPILETQLAFDAYANGQIEALPVSPEVSAEIADVASRARHGFSWKHPAILAVVVGLLLIAGLLGYFWWEAKDNFEGREAIEAMVERTAAMQGNELDPLNYKTGELKDWLFMQGIEGYEVPPEFADYHAVGGRVFRQDGYPVVQLAVDENNMIFSSSTNPTSTSDSRLKTVGRSSRAKAGSPRFAVTATTDS